MSLAARYGCGAIRFICMAMVGNISPENNVNWVYQTVQGIDLNSLLRRYGKPYGETFMD